MTNLKLTELTENTSPELTDIMLITDDPGGTPASQKITLTNLQKGINPMTTAGDIIVGGSSGTPDRLAIGTSTYVLTSNGTTAAWAAPSGGATGWVGTVIDRTVVDSSGLASWDISSIPSTYDVIEIIVMGITNTSSARWVNLSFNNDTTDANYRSAVFGFAYGANPTTAVDGGSNRQAFVLGSTTTGSVSEAKIRITNYASGVMRKVAYISHYAGYGVNSANQYGNDGFIKWEVSATAINRITLTPSADSFGEGTLLVMIGYKSV